MKDYLEKRREELRKQGGFTLMEMLIVVAIIAVLVAIAIPIFTSQLENSREAADAGNIRGAYAEVMANAVTNGSEYSETVTLTQQQDGWQSDAGDKLAGQGLVSGSAHTAVKIDGTPKKGGTAEVKYTPGTSSKDPAVTITFSA